MKGKHIVITGASAGIGEALVRELSNAGAKITLVARRADRLHALAAQLPGETNVLPRDLSDGDTSWLAEAEAALGPIDVLINNAGLQTIGRTQDMDLDKAEQLLRVNLHTPLRLIHAVLPQMTEHGGTIVNISSLAALAPPAGMLWYNASKAGLAAASESLQGELLHSKVHVLTVYPGVIGDTDMGHYGLDSYDDSWSVRIQPRATAAQLAAEIHSSIKNKRARLVYPKANNITRWLPAPTRWLMDRLTPPVR